MELLLFSVEEEILEAVIKIERIDAGRGEMILYGDDDDEDGENTKLPPQPAIDFKEGYNDDEDDDDNSKES